MVNCRTHENLPICVLCHIPFPTPQKKGKLANQAHLGTKLNSKTAYASQSQPPPRAPLTLLSRSSQRNKKNVAAPENAVLSMSSSSLLCPTKSSRIPLHRHPSVYKNNASQKASNLSINNKKASPTNKILTREEITQICGENNFENDYFRRLLEEEKKYSVTWYNPHATHLTIRRKIIHWMCMTGIELTFERYTIYRAIFYFDKLSISLFFLFFSFVECNSRKNSGREMQITV